MKSEDLLNDFIDYCKDHPSERFWQALRNWSGFNFVLVSNNIDAKNNTYTQDTYYWHARNGQRRSIDAE